MENIEHDNSGDYSLTPQKSIKAVLLHNGNKRASLPLGHSMHMKEQYENLPFILDKINYQGPSMAGVRRFKNNINDTGKTRRIHKYMFFVPMCATVKIDWMQKKWLKRTSLEHGTKNGSRGKCCYHPSNIKLELMKQFVKALPNEEECFKHICSEFPGLSTQNSKKSIVTGSNIRKLINDKNFEKKMTTLQKKAFKEVAIKCLRTKLQDYSNIQGFC